MNEALLWPIVCATGHRDLDVEVWGWVERELKRVAESLRDVHGATEAISGMARGVDMYWFEKTDTIEGLNAHAYSPYPQQADRWLAAQRERWRRNIERAREGGRLKYIGNLADIPPKERKSAGNRLLFERNDAMLSDSQVVVAVYDPRRNHNSGTHDTFMKATGQRRIRGQHLVWPVVHINPQTQQTRILTKHLPEAQRNTIRAALAERAAVSAPTTAAA